MSAEIIEKFAQAPAPGFRCSAARGDNDGSFLARAQHVLHSPASSEAVAQIEKSLGAHAAQVLDFYKHHDGFVLYRDTLSEAAGIELLPVGQWQEAAADMR